jgi:hypothetical protein
LVLIDCVQKHVGRGAGTNVAEECFERITPLRADTSPAATPDDACPDSIFCGLPHSMLVVGVCVTPPATFFFGKATAASNSSVAAINLRSGRHDLIAAIALAPPAPPASAVNTDSRHDDQPANALPRFNFDRHFFPQLISRLSRSSSQQRRPFVQKMMLREPWGPGNIGIRECARLGPLRKLAAATKFLPAAGTLCALGHRVHSTSPRRGPNGAAFRSCLTGGERSQGTTAAL